MALNPRRRFSRSDFNRSLVHILEESKLDYTMCVLCLGFAMPVFSFESPSQSLQGCITRDKFESGFSFSDAGLQAPAFVFFHEKLCAIAHSFVDLF